VKLIFFVVVWTIVSLWYWFMAMTVSATMFQDGTARGNSLTILVIFLALAAWAAATVLLIRALDLHHGGSRND
jgi:hypothetical protein